MYKKKAFVVKKTEDKIILSFAKDKACDCCSNLICKANEVTVELNNDVDVNVDDAVELGIDSKWTVFLSFFVFLVPSVIFVAMLIAINNPIKGFFAGILAVGVYFFGFKFFVLKNIEKRIKPKIIRRI